MGQRDDTDGRLDSIPKSLSTIFSLGHQISQVGLYTGGKEVLLPSRLFQALCLIWANTQLEADFENLPNR